jgi:ABC-2 type transport system ATP-binding protein
MARPDAAPVLRAQNLSKRFADGTLALDAVSVTVCAGEMVCLLGGRRSGKSVLLQLVAGVVPSTFGTVSIGGVAVTDPVTSLARIMYLASGVAHAPRLKPAENLHCYATLSGVGSSPGECVQALREVGLPEWALATATGALGTEHCLLIWLAAARLRNAPGLLLDDPSAGLEPAAMRRLQQWLARRREAGTAILVATADVPLASQADRVVILAHGRGVCEKPRSEFTAQTLMALYLDSLGHQ